jgi:hypothetical protein
MVLWHSPTQRCTAWLQLLAIAATLALAAPPTRAHAGPGQSTPAVVYLPLVMQAPPSQLQAAGSAWGVVSAVAADGDRVLVGEGSQVAAYTMGEDGILVALGRSEGLEGVVSDIQWDSGDRAYVVTRATEARLRPDYAPYGPLAVSVLGGDWRAPQVLARSVVTGFADIQIHAGHAFVCGGDGFTVYDLSDPVRWRLLYTVNMPGGPLPNGDFDCRHDGEHTLGVLGDRQGHLLRYDVSNPALPSLVAIDETGVFRFFIGDFAIAAGQVHAIWGMTPMAGGTQYLYVPSAAFPGEGVPKLDFGYEAPGPPVLRGGLAHFRTRGGNVSAGSLTIVDPAGSPELRRRSRLPLGFSPGDMAISGDRAWLVGGQELQAIDIADPDAPAAMGYLSRPGRLRTIAAAGGRVFVASADRPELAVFSEAGTAPADTSVLGTWTLALATAPGAPLVAIEDPPWLEESVALTVYTADAALRPLGQLALDGDDPFGPLGTIGTGQINEVIVAGNRAYVVRDSSVPDPSRGAVLVAEIIDLHEPSQPVRLGQVVVDRRKPAGFGGIAVHGERLFVALGGLGEVVEVDISDPTVPVEVARHVIGGGVAGGLTVAGDHLLIAAGAAGLRVVDLAGGWRELDQLGGIGWALDVVADGNMAYAATGDGRLVSVELGRDGALILADSLPLPAGGSKLVLDGNRLWVEMGAAGANSFEIRRR